ncbi:hybrid sensor histidine kinase/response regulator [uncultured Azohydromonas sp.]|uniref:ATP-binding response regulator n=1 Tax=uncultured Azohydromonas sp. TaxID=487342 RepID=UPI0026029A69|nr:hybrid sensor histidine kinase/response regulator [uncultured Azohydromonas sp.]
MSGVNIAAALAGRAARGSFVAVGGQEPVPGATPRTWTERRARERRLHDQARAELLQAAPGVVAAVLGALAVALVLSPRSLGVLAWASCTAALWLLWAWKPDWLCGPPVPRIAVYRAYVGVTGLALALLALMAWLPTGETERWLLLIVLAMVAFVVAGGLAPLGRAVLLALLLPGSATLALAWTVRQQPGPAATVLGAGGLLCAVVAALALHRHRHWRAQATVQLEREERLCALGTERDQALRADRDKTRFLANASHDLRQPVHAIGLFAATLEKRLRGTGDEPYIRNLIRCIEALERSFNAMLDVSRLDAGSVEPAQQTFPLRDVFRRLHMQFAGQAELAGLNLRFSPGGKCVRSDPQLLERLLANLVQNALKYTEKGGVVVVARSTATHVNIEVWDTGVGIGATELPRVFDEFYQVGRGGRSRAQGLGMGLAIVKRLAQLLGHELSVVSQPGRGTMFRVGVARAEREAPQDAAGPDCTLPMPEAASRTVLVIEDEEPIREALGALLREWGHRVVLAASAREAVMAQRTQALPPDLILSDLHLGEGPDGIAAIEALRHHWRCELPAVLVTGDTTHEELRRATESGFQVLVKPVAARRLLQVLRSLSG